MTFTGINAKSPTLVITKAANELEAGWTHRRRAFCAALCFVGMIWPASVCFAQLPISIDEFPIPAGNACATSITVGPDSALWFTAGIKIGRITTAGTFTYYPLTQSMNMPREITQGPDAALWFTDLNKKIGRITPAGEVAEFPLNAYPQGIVAGPDGALWFTEGDKIGRITTDGTLTEFPVPTRNSAPWGIAAGPDGALWFTENNDDKIGRITTSGVVTEFPLPNAFSSPTSITAGPDGALWFIEFNGNRIGRITAAGILTEFLVPKAGPIQGITTGPDGALWFTHYNELGDSIWRITTSGSFTEFPSSLASLIGITAGPDGALWLTGINWKIGRAAIPQPTLSVTTTDSYSPDLVSPWGTLTYAIQVTNAGAADVVNPIVKDVLPARIEYLGTSGNGWNCSQAGSEVTCAMPSLVPGPASPITITVIAAASLGTVVNRVSVTGSNATGVAWATTQTQVAVPAPPPSIHITEFRVPTARSAPAGITAGPDGALWFTENSGHAIGRITTTGAVTEFPIHRPAGSLDPIGPFGITAGPDGALWFTEIADGIGRITTTGAITEFPRPTPECNPRGITAGPDGALWFTEYSSDYKIGKIGRITTAGITTEFPLPAGSEPFGITAGPDGALWFTNGANKIGRITTAGAVTEFTITSGMGASWITAGPDGALWFPGYPYSGWIGRIATDGVVTEFRLALPGFPALDAKRITLGPDGALWFTTYADRIGRITTTGAVSLFPVPTPNSELCDITAGPDGALWFTEQGANKIGKLFPPSSVDIPMLNTWGLLILAVVLMAASLRCLSIGRSFYILASAKSR